MLIFTSPIQSLKVL